MDCLCWIYFLEKCPATVLITSTGLAKTHHSSRLGKYIEDGISNGHISYKNPEGWYLHFAPDGEWVVSKRTKHTNCTVRQTSRYLHTWGISNLWIYILLTATLTMFFQISSENYKGTNIAFLTSNCGFDCPEKCTKTWQAYFDGSWKKDSTLAVIKEGQ